jgi:hypothetical protein
MGDTASDLLDQRRQQLELRKLELENARLEREGWISPAFASAIVAAAAVLVSLVVGASQAFQAWQNSHSEQIRHARLLEIEETRLVATVITPYIESLNARVTRENETERNALIADIERGFPCRIATQLLGRIAEDMRLVRDTRLRAAEALARKGAECSGQTPRRSSLRLPSLIASAQAQSAPAAPTRPTRLMIFISDPAAAGLAEETAALLGVSPSAREVLLPLQSHGPVQECVRGTEVRYYHAADRDAAEALARRIEARAPCGETKARLVDPLPSYLGECAPVRPEAQQSRCREMQVAARPVGQIEVWLPARPPVVPGACEAVPAGAPSAAPAAAAFPDAVISLYVLMPVTAPEGDQPRQTARARDLVARLVAGGWPQIQVNTWPQPSVTAPTGPRTLRIYVSSASVQPVAARLAAAIRVAADRPTLQAEVCRLDERYARLRRPQVEVWLPFMAPL